MTQQLISVILPAHNAGKYIEQALKSILNQSWKWTEIIIVDDASTDATKDILLSLDNNNHNIRIITNDTNQGIVHCLNMAIDSASSEFIARMDADDIAHPSRLEKQLAFLQANPNVVVVGSNIELIDHQGRTIGFRKYPEYNGAILDAMKDYSPFCHPSVMFRKSAVLQAGGYREKYPVAQDYDLWLRLRNYGKMANLQEPLLKYRIHPGQVTVKKLNNQHRAHMAARKENLGIGDYPLWYKLRGQKYTLGSKYMTLSYQQQKLDQPTVALQLCLHALRYSPLSEEAWRFLWGRVKRSRIYDLCLWYSKKIKRSVP